MMHFSVHCSTIIMFTKFIDNHQAHVSIWHLKACHIVNFQVSTIYGK